MNTKCTEGFFDHFLLSAGESLELGKLVKREKMQKNLPCVETKQNKKCLSFFVSNACGTCRSVSPHIQNPLLTCSDKITSKLILLDAVVANLMVTFKVSGNYSDTILTSFVRNNL